MSEELRPLSAAVGRGEGFAAIARAAAEALGASLAITDRTATVLAVAALSPEEEARLRSRGAGVERRRLEVAAEPVGELRLRWRDEPADQGTTDLVATVIALELERVRSSEWADEEAAASLVDAILERRLSTGEDINGRATEVGLELEEGAGVVIARIEPGADAGEDWPARALTAGLRSARTGGRGSLVALTEDEGYAEVRAIVPCSDTDELARISRSIAREIADSVPAVKLSAGHGRHADRADELYRAGREALLALNVAEAEEAEVLAFEETGSYRLLLSTMSENPAELQWFYDDTIAPLIAYDEQYGTDLVTTVETFLENDGNIAPTAEVLFAHRHTIRYRLGRVRDLCGYDVQTTDGRERLGFGLKVMRVLGRGHRRGSGPGPPG